jgi:hypothetical protein
LVKSEGEQHHVLQGSFQGLVPIPFWGLQLELS